MLVFVVARTRLDRYEELCQHCMDWPDVRVVLDRREGERRTPQGTFAGVNRRRVERRHRMNDEPYLKLGWDVVEPDECVS